MSRWTPNPGVNAARKTFPGAKDLGLFGDMPPPRTPKGVDGLSEKFREMGGEVYVEV